MSLTNPECRGAVPTGCTRACEVWNTLSARACGTTTSAKNNATIDPMASVLRCISASSDSGWAASLRARLPDRPRCETGVLVRESLRVVAAAILADRKVLLVSKRAAPDVFYLPGGKPDA